MRGKENFVLVFHLPKKNKKKISVGKSFSLCDVVHQLAPELLGDGWSFADKDNNNLSLDTKVEQLNSTNIYVSRISLEEKRKSQKSPKNKDKIKTGFPGWLINFESANIKEFNLTEHINQSISTTDKDDESAIIEESVLEKFFKICSRKDTLERLIIDLSILGVIFTVEGSKWPVPPKIELPIHLLVNAIINNPKLEYLNMKGIRISIQMFDKLIKHLQSHCSLISIDYVVDALLSNLAVSEYSNVGLDEVMNNLKKTVEEIILKPNRENIKCFKGESNILDLRNREYIRRDSLRTIFKASASNLKILILDNCSLGEQISKDKLKLLYSSVDIIKHSHILSLSHSEHKLCKECSKMSELLYHCDWCENERSAYNICVDCVSGLGVFNLFSQFSFIPQLEQLSLKKNKLSRFPQEISMLTNLKHLYLDNNQITSINSDVLHNLGELEKLSCEANNIREIPEALLRLPKFQCLNIAKNIIEIPNDIPAKYFKKNSTLDQQKLVIYLKKIFKISTILNSCPVILLGDPSVGKSSLVLSLSSIKKSNKRQAVDRTSKKILLNRNLTASDSSNFHELSSSKKTFSISSPVFRSDVERDQPPPMNTTNVVMRDENLEVCKKITFVFREFSCKRQMHYVYPLYFNKYALYIICFKYALDKKKLIPSLVYWIRLVTSNAPNAPILLVGTHANSSGNNNRTRSDTPKNYKAERKSSINMRERKIDLDKVKGWTKSLKTTLLSLGIRNVARILLVSNMTSFGIPKLYDCILSTVKVGTSVFPYLPLQKEIPPQWLKLPESFKSQPKIITRKVWEKKLKETLKKTQSARFKSFTEDQQMMFITHLLQQLGHLIFINSRDVATNESYLPELKKMQDHTYIMQKKDLLTESVKSKSNPIFTSRKAASTEGSPNIIRKTYDDYIKMHTIPTITQKRAMVPLFQAPSSLPSFTAREAPSETTTHVLLDPLWLLKLLDKLRCSLVKIEKAKSPSAVRRLRRSETEKKNNSLNYLDDKTCKIVKEDLFDFWSEMSEGLACENIRCVLENINYLYQTSTGIIFVPLDPTKRPPENHLTTFWIEKPELVTLRIIEFDFTTEGYLFSMVISFLKHDWKLLIAWKNGSILKKAGIHLKIEETGSIQNTIIIKVIGEQSEKLLLETMRIILDFLLWSWGSAPKSILAPCPSCSSKGILVQHLFDWQECRKCCFNSQPNLIHCPKCNENVNIFTLAPELYYFITIKT